jgi:hypothetical protein
MEKAQEDLPEGKYSKINSLEETLKWVSSPVSSEQRRLIVFVVDGATSLAWRSSSDTDYAATRSGRHAVTRIGAMSLISSVAFC